MKLSLLVLCLVAVVSAHRRKKLPGLKHFNKNGLSHNFKHYHLPADSGCDPAVENQIKCAHKLACKCVILWMQSEQGPELARCKRQDAVKAADKAWQEASFRHHLAMQKCLQGAPPDVQQEETFLFRKRRSFHQSHESHGSSEEESCQLNFDNHQACWQAYKERKRQASESIQACTNFARCYGIDSAAPEGGDELYWFNRVKELAAEKKQAVGAYMRVFYQCLGTEPPNWE